jgi:class 3 adenylate cyclase
LTTVDHVSEARAAFTRSSWEAAVEHYEAADETVALEPQDLADLSDALWWLGRPDEATDALERAYRGFVEAGETEKAAIIAFRLAYLAFRRRAVPVGAGWFQRMEKLLADEPESPAHAWLKLLRSARSLFIDHDWDATLRFSDEVLEIGERLGTRDPCAIAQGNKGYILIARGEGEDGFALIDDATASAVAGELDLRVASDVYCNTIAAYRDAAAYERAGEWTEEADRWMKRHSLGGYPGVCRVHRAELKRMRGSWAEAEREARLACDELEKFGLLDAVGFAHYEIGEIRLRMGDLAAAEEAFDKAYEWGKSGQPGMALLQLARGDADGAANSIHAALRKLSTEDERAHVVRRARLLPAQVRIARVRGDTATAERAAAELHGIADAFDRPALRAAAMVADGTVSLMSGDYEAAIDFLDGAWRMWRDANFPYESAQARALLGVARMEAGDDSAAKRELRAARSAFAELGAGRDAAEVAGLLGAEPMAPSRKRVVKTFMFTDIVTSTDLVGLIGDEPWNELLAWHDQALRSEFGRHRGDVVRHTGDGFFVTFDSAGDAVDCAVAIQRRLTEHRREHGFAPWVRIGFHTAEATPQGSDYSGHGVHVAARVGGLAGRDEIVLSRASLDAAGSIRFPVSEGRMADLKGVADPIEVFSIQWK